MAAEFIAEFEVTLERYQEWAKNPKGEKAVREKKRGVRRQGIMLIFGILMIVLGVWAGNYYEIGAGVFFGFIATNRLFFLQKQMAKRQYDSFLKKAGGEKWVRKVEMGEKIIVTDGIESVEYDYQPQTCMTDEGEYQGLWIDKDTIIRIPKGSFVKGNEEDATAWIEQKSQRNQKEIEGREAE